MRNLDPCVLTATRLGAPLVGATPVPFFNTFFPHVSDVDLASVALTQARISYEYGLPVIGPTSVGIDLRISAVPEPATLALTAGGLVVIAAAGNGACGGAWGGTHNQRTEGRRSR